MSRLSRMFIGLIAGSMLLTGFASAQTAATSQPATVVVAPATTMLAAAATVGDVLVAPFKPLGDAGPDWISKAVQENLTTDLSAARFHPVTADKSFTDNTAAVAGGKAVLAHFVVVGTFQPADGMLRFTGQILNVETGQSVAGLSATGSVRDLFALEDSLSQQAIRALATQRATVAAKPGAAAAAGGAPAGAAPGGNPAVAAGVQPHYQGSALQAYVDANRTPSQDFNTQVQNSRDNNTYGTYNSGPFNAGYGYYGPGYGIGYGGFGFSSIVYGGGHYGGGYYGGGFYGGGYSGYGGGTHVGYPGGGGHHR